MPIRDNLRMFVVCQILFSYQLLAVSFLAFEVVGWVEG